MTEHNINVFISTHSKYFGDNKLLRVKKLLKKASDSSFTNIMWANYKNPITIIILSTLLGMFGVDRFMLGKVTSGALKILLPAFISVLNLFIISYMAINPKPVHFLFY